MSNLENNRQNGASATRGTRCIALVGPYSSGKTTLLEAILYRTGKIDRQGSVDVGNSVGDATPEARAHGMSVEVNCANTQFMGDTYSFIDCPGSVEFSQEARGVLAACDAAIVVCEADEKKTHALQLTLKQLDDLGLPRFVFVNKIDKNENRLRDVLEFMQPASEAKLVLRQVPIREGGIATGFVDLALERAYVYREHAASEVIDMPDDLSKREKDARFEMLENLADFDDELLEQLLSDIEPPQDKVFEELAQELSQGLITPVLFGSAENGNGILRLLKALRHEVPFVETVSERLGVLQSDTAVVQVLKTMFTAHGGKLSLGRVLSGTIHDGDTLFSGADNSERVSGIFTLNGLETKKLDKAGAGDVVALGRLESVNTGDTLAADKTVESLDVFEIAPPVFGLAVRASDRKDEVKLPGAIAKLIQEDPSLSLEHNTVTHEMVLWGQGEMHLRVAIERLTGKFGVGADTSPRRIAYKETIRKPCKLRRRYKKQSGGHGQFGDVELEISPQARGAGFTFTNTITGGSVPRQYIPATEMGVREYLERGPLGFPVIDIAVNLSDGSYHGVDSSEMAFKQAARVTMSEAMPQCSPVLLEPVVAVQIHVPNDATARVNQIVSGHRGQLLGFDAREGWSGWDTVQAHMPESEIANLIVELRSATAGAGTFTFGHERLAELSGKMAEEVISEQANVAA